MSPLISLLSTMIQSICEIMKEDEYGVGFFSKINYKNNEIYCLLTNNHVLSKDDLENDIKIKIDGETKILSLKGRKKWTNKEMDFTCIEIKEEEDNIHTFFIHIVLHFFI